ncbi:MAG: hypothetical protein KDD82_19065 [Planctomycetes bacterium]|nr:hypothetical protein [Planctomycetota bacterium]
MKAEYAVGAAVSVLMLGGFGVWLLAPTPLPPAPPPAPALPLPAGGTPGSGGSATTSSSADPELGLSAPERLGKVLARAQQAGDAEAERAAAAELNLVLGELADEDGLGHARELLDPAQEPTLQELGVRLLSKLASAEAAVEEGRAATDPRLAPQARLLLIYSLGKRKDDPATREALWTIVENRADDAEVRSFAIGAVGDAPGATPRLLRLAQASDETPLVRGSAYLALRDAGDPQAAKQALEAFQADPAMAEELTRLEAE